MAVVVVGLEFARAYRLLTAVRPPSAVEWDAETDTATFTWTPDLTAQEAALFADHVAFLRQQDMRLTLAEYQGIRPDIEGLRAYHALASPTAAQTAQATKAIIRVLRAIFRD